MTNGPIRIQYFRTPIQLVVFIRFVRFVRRDEMSLTDYGIFQIQLFLKTFFTNSGIWNNLRHWEFLWIILITDRIIIIHESETS